MKKKLISFLLIFGLLAALSTSLSHASQMPCFIGVNDTLLPFRDATMPAYFGTKLYVPASVFTEFGISSGTSASKDNLYVYRGEKQHLTFFISLGAVMDQNGNTAESVKVEIIDGLYFLPLEFICEFFDLTHSLLPNDPVSVLRIKNSDAVYNDRTFIGNYKKQIEQIYKEYSTPLTTPPSFTSPPTDNPIIQDYENVTVYLTFYGVNEEYTPEILDTLSDFSVTACFFLSAADIVENPSLVRRISGERHMIGILLDNAEYREYAEASQLLFEAAKLVTPLVSSNSEIEADISIMCSEYGLIYRKADIEPDDNSNAAVVTAALPVIPYSSVDIRFPCTQNTSRILNAVIRYLENYNFTVLMITETQS